MAYIDERFIQESVETIGERKHMLLLIEGCAKLSQGMAQFMRRHSEDCRTRLVEEMANCYIMANCAMEILGITDSVLQKAIDDEVKKAQRSFDEFNE